MAKKKVVTTTTTTTTTTVINDSTPQITYVAMILDESGSMNMAKQSIINHFQEQVEMLQEQQKTDGDHDIRISLTKFSNNTQVVFLDKTPQQVPMLTNESYTPMGGTALYDAVGQTIARIKETADLTANNVSVLVLIFSDGEENASRQYNSSMVSQQITECKNTGKWTFTYMGGNAASLEKVSKSLNIDIGNMAAFDISSVSGYASGAETMRNATKAFMDTRTAFSKSNIGGSGVAYQSTSFFDIEGEIKKAQDFKNSTGSQGPG